MSRDPNGKTLYREKHVQGPGDSNGPAGSGGARRAARLRERGRRAAGRRGPRGSGGRSAGGLGTTARPLRPPGGATRKQERERCHLTPQLLWGEWSVGAHTRRQGHRLGAVTAVQRVTTEVEKHRQAQDTARWSGSSEGQGPPHNCPYDGPRSAPTPTSHSYLQIHIDGADDHLDALSGDGLLVLSQHLLSGQS